MPSPKLRTLGRRALTEAQRIEATLGPAVDRPSLFSSTAEAADARDRVRLEAADRGQLETLILGGPLLKELADRHLRHAGTIRDSATCHACNPYGWQPEWMTGEWARESAERSERSLTALIDRDARLSRGVKDEVLAN
jgi:hypothetical protein